MSSILLKGVIRNGRVEVDEPIDLPDGTEVVVTTGTSIPDGDGPMSPEEITRVQAAMEPLKSFDFMTEDEQGDDPVLIQEWIDDLRSIPPVPENPKKEAGWRVWEEKMRLFNIENRTSPRTMVSALLRAGADGNESGVEDRLFTKKIIENMNA